MRARSLAMGALVALVTFGSTGRAQDEDDPPPPSNPHAGGMPGMFQPPPDTSEEDPRVPGGSISVSILDPDNKPLPNVIVTLGILHQSVAKGESRERKLGTTDAQGNVVFSGLERGSGIAYRVMVTKDGGQFDASPFMLPAATGMRVTEHVYPVTHDIDSAIVVTQVATLLEMKDDRAQIDEEITILNVGRVAWVPQDLVLSLPKDFTGFAASQSMSDQGVEEYDAKGVKGVRLHGTFAPGQHAIQFRWQLPHDADSAEVAVDEGMPPHLYAARVIVAASEANHVVATGFPEAQVTSMQGERVLVTEKQMKKGDPALRTLHFELRDLPVQGPARLLATAAAALIALGGLAFAFLSGRRSIERTAAGGSEIRTRLLDELAELERAHATGDVGPKTYERARRALIDAIARTLASKEAPSPGGGGAREASTA